jgi:hypothetical protein
MKTQNTNNRTNKVVKIIALTIATVYSIPALSGAIYILLNIDKVSFNF